MSLKRQTARTLPIEQPPGVWFHMFATNKLTKRLHKERNVMNRLGKKFITRAAVAAVATSLLVGGAQVFAAERLSDGGTVLVELDSYNTKTNYTFVPDVTGDYNFSASESDNDRMSPSVRIYRGSTLIGEFDGEYLVSLEAGVSYQIQARETGLKRGQEGSYSLTVSSIAPSVIPEDVAPDYGMENLFDDVIYVPVIEDTEDDTVVISNPTPAPSVVNDTPAAAPSTSNAVAATTTLLPSASPRAMVEGFVDRLYTTVLNRQPDEAGKTYWVNQILNEQASGSKIAEGFLNSAEFLARDLDNEDFVETLYTVFFNRVPSDAEVDNWEDALDNGATRAAVIDGFAASAEWSNTCSGFGITK